MAIINNHSFKSPVVGIDPVTKGSFTIEWAYITHNLSLNDENSKWRQGMDGSFTISGEDNPLFLAVKDYALRLQGLVGRVDFGVERKFIKIESISKFMVYEEKSLISFLAVFNTMDNLEYLEEVQTYRDDNLI